MPHHDAGLPRGDRFPSSTIKHMGALTFWKRDSRHPQPQPPREIMEAGPQEQVKLVLHLSGDAQLEGGGRVEPLRPSTWGLYGFSKVCNIKGAYTQLIVSIPRPLLAARSPHFPRIMKRQFPAETPAISLAFHFFTSLYDSESSRTYYPHELGDVGIHLLQVALAEQFARLEGHTRQEKFRARIMSYVDMNIHDPTLTVEGIARTHQCSSRYLQKIFGGRESIGRYLWRMRLERCCAALSDPTNAGRSITEIAFSLGFSNPSHFSRAFRQRYATSPSAFRQQALGKGSSSGDFSR